MRGVTRKLLISVLSLFMVCLIASTSTTTVAAPGSWGTLKAGDEIQWQSSIFGTVTIKVLNVDGDIITLEFTDKYGTETYNIDADESFIEGDKQQIINWLIAKSDLTNRATKNYEWQGTTYKAYYTKHEYADGSKDEDWRDFNTGIIFESRFTDAEGNAEVDDKLISTNADLAESGGGCLGTILIALVSITTVVTYSLVSYRKKKTN